MIVVKLWYCGLISVGLVTGTLMIGQINLELVIVMVYYIYVVRKRMRILHGCILFFSEPFTFVMYIICCPQPASRCQFAFLGGMESIFHFHFTDC